MFSFLKKIVNFLGDLLSDSHQVSLKRFIALVAFAMLIVVVFVSLKKDFAATNVDLLKDSEKYLFYIVGLGILGVAATDIFGKKSD